MPQLDQSAKSLSAIDRGVQHFVVVVGEPIHARLDIGRDPRTFTCDVGTSLVVGDTVADKLPGTVHTRLPAGAVARPKVYAGASADVASVLLVPRSVTWLASLSAPLRSASNTQAVHCINDDRVPNTWFRE
ncbi:hypothetical protein D3C77_379230 [compost metagenome]